MNENLKELPLHLCGEMKKKNVKNLVDAINVAAKQFGEKEQVRIQQCGEDDWELVPLNDELPSRECAKEIKKLFDRFENIACDE